MNDEYKQYIVVGYDYYYPGGGLNDILNSFDDLIEAKKYMKKQRYDIKYIVEKDTWKNIYEGE